MKQTNKENYYCENCFAEPLKEWIEEKDGTIVCSQKCAEELDRIKEDSKPKPRRKKERLGNRKNKEMSANNGKSNL